MKISIEQFVDYCKNQHDVECNQKYDKTKPYSFHLNMVAEQAELFNHLLTERDFVLAFCGCWGHDLIEDARVTYNDIISFSGSEVLAEIIFCCTEERGRNRRERHSTKYFEDLSNNPLATFVKLCDVMANIKYSEQTGSSMFDKYKNEFPKLKHFLYRKEYDEMFVYIEKLLYIK